jgi:hypothetical protein
MFYTTEQLLVSIKTRTLAPSGQNTFQDSDLIQLANEELQLSLVPDMLSNREDYFLNLKNVALVDGVDLYTTPERSIGNTLKEVIFKDVNTNRISLPRKSVEDLEVYNEGGPVPNGFIVVGDEIKIVPSPQNPTGSLDLWHFQRPNQLVPTSECAKITAITDNDPNVVLTVDTDLSATLTVGALCDVLSAKSPFLLWGQDCVVSGSTSSQITIPKSSIVDGSGAIQVQVNDYLCPAQKCNIPMIPEDLHPLLAQMTAQRVVEALGDAAKLQMINSKLSDMRRQAMQMISNRVETEIMPIRNRRGILNSINSYGYLNRR